MGKSSKGTKGYKYFTSLVLMLGNRIECLLGVNFDKKGWQKPVVLKDDENMLAGVHKFDLPELYGDTEGGISGQLALYDGNVAQMPDSYYQQYFPLAPAYRHQSYVVLRDFYVGNSPYLKDVMFLPKRTQIRNDGSEQWYKIREDGAVVCEIEAQNGGGDIIHIHKNPEVLACNRQSYYSISGSLWHSDDEDFSVFYMENGDFYYEGKHYIGDGVWGWLNNEEYIAEASHLTNFGNVDCVVEINLRIELFGDLTEYEIISEGKLYKNDIKRTQMQSQSGGEYFLYEIKRIQKTKNFLKVIARAESKGGRLDNAVRIYVQIKAIEYEENKKIDGIDINPIHKARELITDYTAMGKPESDIHDENFRAAASRIWDEGLGISWAIQEKSCKEALQELEAHIEGGFRINRQTGLYECVLFRDDLLDLNNALYFDESNIKTVEFDTINADDAINSYNVSYYDRENLKDSTFSIDDVGLIHTVGHVNAEKLDFPYFMNRRNAEIVANWKLKQASTAAWKGSFTTGRYDARKINKYDVILLSWQSKQLVNVPIRVLNISLGDGVDNTVTIDFIEVVSYSENMNAQINSDESMNTVLEPQSNNAVVFEAPYYELVQENGQANVNLELENNAEAGYLMTAVSKPQNNSIYALLYTDKATEDYANLEKVGYVDYCPSLTLDQDISFTDSVFSVKNATEMSLAKVGTLILLDDELLVYQSYDAVTNKLTVKRAALDTVPKPHLLNAVFYFFDEFRFIDTEQYVANESVQAQILTTTPSAVQKRDQIDVKKLEMNARAVKPYPPANVKINNSFMPNYFDEGIEVTWANRNRVQQTGGEIIGYFESSVTLERNTQTLLNVIEFDSSGSEIITHSTNVTAVNSWALDQLSINANTHTISINIKTSRDGYECLYPFSHTIIKSTLVPPSNVKFEVLEY